jgi:hypothetical protein
MRIFNIAAVAACFLALSVSAMASQSPSDTSSDNTSMSHPYANIRANDWTVTTSNIQYNYNSVSKSSMTMAPGAEYFVIDRLSLGAVTSLTTNFDNMTVISAGPSATYHFWNQDHFSSYGSANFLFQNLTKNSGGDITNGINVIVGANYNLAPWFGVGPRLTYNIQTATGTSNSVNLDAINLFFYF